jgi:predicted acetylornithine/succinylornithine family transaminase
MTTEEIARLYERYVMDTYSPRVALVRGRGARVWDAEGREYLDFLSGIAVTSLGHAHPRLTRAIRKQAGTLIHGSNIFYHELHAKLAEALSSRSLQGRCFFCNSGAEANEALIKLARLWGHDRGRYEVISMRQSFHGRTLATLTATGQDKVQKGFEPLPSGFAYAQFNDLDSVRSAVTPRTAAILVEAIQGEGGVLPAAPGFLQGVRQLCDEQDLLLFFDEVQCGMGRTGKWFAYQHDGVEPDAISVAKGLGGGFPIGAVVAGPKLSHVFRPGHHATTFGGTPLACAAALAVLETLEAEDLVNRAGEMGTRFMNQLRKATRSFSFVKEIRGRGLMVGMVLDRPAAGLESVLREKGLLVLTTAGNVIRFLPPLIVSRAQIGQAVRRVKAACAEWDVSAAG